MIGVLRKFLPRTFSLITSVPKRCLTVSARLSHGDYEWEDPKSPEDIVNVTYVDREEIEHKIKGKVGDNLMFLAHRHDIDIEGACEAALVKIKLSINYFFLRYFDLFVGNLGCFKNLSGLLYVPRLC